MKSKVIVAAGLLMLVAGCYEDSEEFDGIQTRFSSPEGSFSVYLIKDSQTGCEYITKGSYSSFTYVHGSCPDVIRNEQGGNDNG